MDKADRARLRSWAMDADHPTYPTPGERGTILQLLDALDAAEAERDAALERERVLREALVWITTETFVCVGSGGHLRWSEWLRVQDRARAALAATAKESE